MCGKTGKAHAHVSARATSAEHLWPCAAHLGHPRANPFDCEVAEAAGAGLCAAFAAVRAAAAEPAAAAAAAPTWPCCRTPYRGGRTAETA